MNKNKLLQYFNLFIFVICMPIWVNSEEILQKPKKQSLLDVMGKTSFDPKNISPSVTTESIKNESSDVPKTEITKAQKAPLKIDKAKKIKKEIVQKEETIKPKNFELNFENAALQNVIDYISELFDVTFLPDDAVSDERKLKGVNDVKVTFRSNKTFTAKQVWEFLDLVLEIAGLSRIAMPGEPITFYRITQIATANKSNIPVFIGTNPDELPDYQRIRYLYFVKNKQAAQIRDLISKLQSKNALIEIFQDLNALILTDSAYNIKVLMQIITKLDEAGLPEILSVLKLKSADAADVARLYETLKGKEDVFRPFQENKKNSRLTEGTKVIAEPRTNSLIIFGPKDSVQRLEDFIKKHIDKELEDQPSNIHVYDLNYAPAEQIASILNSATQFGAESEAAKFGGIRNGEKYLSRLYFEPEKQGNRLIVRGDLEDYKLVKKIIEQLDQQQPQVAIEVFIVTTSFDKKKALYSQIRNKTNEKINFQTSGFNGQGIEVVPQRQPNAGSIVANLINLATTVPIGTTLISLGKQSVWALLGILDTVTDTNIIANPFIVATNKYTSTVSVGQTRRITTGTIVGATANTNEIGNIDANLSVSITPQINDYGIINLAIDVTVENFTDPTNPNSGNKTIRKVTTNANVADKEVLALGGLIRDTTSIVESSFPILGRIPLIGLLFQNKADEIIKENIIIFMSPRIIRPQGQLVAPYTQHKADLIRVTLDDIDSRANLRDPVKKWFFQEPIPENRITVDNFIPQKAEGKKPRPMPIIRPRRSLTDCVRDKGCAPC